VEAGHRSSGYLHCGAPGKTIPYPVGSLGSYFPHWFLAVLRPNGDGGDLIGFRAWDIALESDCDVYLRSSDPVEMVQLEALIFFGILGKSDEKLEARLSRAWAKDAQGPRLVVTKTEGPSIPIEKPGYSVKHGKLADQHPLQREAYDAAFAVGFQVALDAIVLKGMTEQDIYYSAQRHEERALAEVAVESSKQAGLAKGAKMAAYRYHHELVGMSASKSPSGVAWTPITDHSDAGLSAAMNGLSAKAWSEIGRLAWQMQPDDPGVLFEMDKDASSAPQNLVSLWYDHNLVIEFNWMRWGRFGKGSKFSAEKAAKALPKASAEDAMRLMTALIRAERFSDDVWEEALSSGLFAAVLHRLLQWRDQTVVG
jgi:Family of unknown function (DUF6508)